VLENSRCQLGGVVAQGRRRMHTVMRSVEPRVERSATPPRHRSLLHGPWRR
jgi:hypothetical protein